MRACRILLVAAGAAAYVAPVRGADRWVGPGAPGAAYPAGEEDRQYAILEHDLRQRARFEKVAPETHRKESLIFESDRDPLDVILRRTRALLEDIRGMGGARDLSAEAGRLDALRERARAIAVENRVERRAVFDEACRLRRAIAFANPLLDFSEIVFIKRHLALMDHMCDQYYGIAQVPGGGIYVLSEPFGGSPRIRSVLEGAVVANGRLKGQELSGGPKKAWKTAFEKRNRWCPVATTSDGGWRLFFDGLGNLEGSETEGGSFLSPDLSFDGKTIAFAYVECQGERSHRTHTDPARGHWAEGRCYHIFTCGLDGTGLRMLTDGTWNDFDPCFMPGGRIAFISERRGGYLRCGRICPTYTLHDMRADGRDIRCLSPHETNEWQPSVANDGMIVWTRWDYVDRHGVVAHMPWITSPDGRDPRVVHGNYSFRGRRPDMELDLRAIPGSARFVATAAPHHGQAFGSLILVDPRAQDDDAMGPVRRVTPDVGFPESQDGTIAYGSPWPLSEDYFLCTYEPANVPGLAPGRTHGIHLVDAFGNKELIYRDPDIACHSPIPVAPRRPPPVVPDGSVQVAGGKAAEATVAVVNVYDSMKPWPEGEKIAALRVYQVLPQTLGSVELPHATGIQIPFTLSVNVARSVLGTVPVEADGSAHFTVPARKELFFQALDEKGLAMQSMRSATHFQPGETRVCQGCHEPRHRAPVARVEAPLALRRGPSRLRPDVDGTNPFSYPRLVQPVLNKHCAGCHAENPGRAPRLDAAQVRIKEGKWWMDGTYYASYLSLAKDFGFYDYGGHDFADERAYRTQPGRFGARASKLYPMLVNGHHDVRLSPEELHRIAVWLDSTSPFYGVYDPEGGLAQLRGEVARPSLE